jgi:hypothetical protein
MLGGWGRSVHAATGKMGQRHVGIVIDRGQRQERTEGR